MSEEIHLSVDAMGGDFGPRLCVEAAASFIAKHSNVRITLVGDKAAVSSCIPPQADLSRLNVLHADQVVDMADKPSQALRHKKNSSMWRALQLVADGEAQACVSGGNTGALMAIGCHLLKTIAGIDRPAIAKQIPTARGSSVLLDLGANLECSPQQLFQFGLMGQGLARVYGKSEPTVALLNVGSELTKGNDVIQDTAQLMGDCADMHFRGFVEGDSLYSGEVDVVVCDGFIGNVALKVSEGVAKFVFGDLRSRIGRGVRSRLLAWLAKPVLKPWAEQFRPAKYNGAALLGLKGVVIKSHGGADAEGFEQALYVALEQASAGIPLKIQASLAAMLGAGLETK